MNNLLRSMVPVQEDTDFSASNWRYRRTIIMVSLLVCGICVLGVSLVIIAAIARIAWTGSSPSYDANLLRLAEALVWATLTFAGSIIGAYVFGANFDSKDYRKSVVELSSRGVVTTVESKVVTTPVTPTPAPVDPVPDQGTQPDVEPTPPYAADTNGTIATSKAKQEPAG